MKILYYDCFSGISGDMNLAAIIDLGVDPDYLRAELAKLGLDHEFELKVGADSRKGICGTRVDVLLKDHHHHAHRHVPKEHGGGDGHHGEGDSGHQHRGDRNLRDIEGIITASSLSRQVKDTSLAIFGKVAAAEARVHGKGIYEVHFHEVGATDSIVDIVGAAICFHRLGVDAVWSSPVELGGGFVRCAHGMMPVPAPATVELLAGIPTSRGAVPSETTTPTGAAILAALVDQFTATPQLVTEKTAYGIGHRDTEIPNVLRVQLATPAAGEQIVRKR
jgi:pyridinium-3,5-bisthiocarboxylic acid mononucleotide nickel chelatase